MKREFKNQVISGLNRTNHIQSEIISDNDLQPLPLVLQKYLRYVGVVGKEKVKNVNIKFNGRIRGKPDDGWMKLNSNQYSFFDNPTRLFYMKASKSGIPALGLHHYTNGKASMQVKLLNLFTLIDAKGKEMDQSETVTFFNDMCLLAPATLIDTAIKWEVMDNLCLKAGFTKNNISISAFLYFNEEGQLINFASDDRYCYMPDKSFKKFRWTTPVKEYAYFNGYNLAKSTDVYWAYPECDFCYGEFTLVGISFNCKSLQ